jgi:radical SAM protein with 4Fe4S-binding SPASM domain
MKNEEGNPDHRGTVSDWACPQLWQRMTITWDGKILPCVHDIYEWMSFGNVLDISIHDAWKSAREEEYRNLHRTGRAHELPACDRCPLRENEIRKLCGGGS